MNPNSDTNTSGLGSDPGVMLFDTDDARDQVRRYIASQDWWVFPAFTDRALQFCGVVERRYYQDAANADFIIMFGPQFLTLAFAHKRRMSPDQLAPLLGKTVDELKTHDILIVGEGPDDEYAILKTVQFYQWVKGSDGWTASGLDQ